MDANRQEFVDFLNQYMKDNQLTVENLSKLFDCNRNAIKRWLKGLYYPRVETLTKISDYFHCSIDYLFGLSDVEQFTPISLPSTFIERFDSVKSMSDYRISKACGIGNSTVAKWRKYGRTPDTETLIKLAKLFDCSIEFLIGRSTK